MQNPASGGTISTPKILLVEDDHSQVRLLKTWLEHMPERPAVVTSCEGPTATQLVRNARWDLIVSDIQLPVWTGLELARLAKGLDAATPVLLITAHERMDYALEAVRSKVDDFLIKPFSRQTLVSKVSSLLAKKNRPQKA